MTAFEAKRIVMEVILVFLPLCLAIFFIVRMAVFNCTVTNDLPKMYMSFKRFRKLYVINTDRYWYHEWNYSASKHLFLRDNNRIVRLQICFHYISYICFLIWTWCEAINFNRREKQKTDIEATKVLLKYTSIDINKMKKKAARYVKDAEDIITKVKGEVTP